LLFFSDPHNTEGSHTYTSPNAIDNALRDLTPEPFRVPRVQGLFSTAFLPLSALDRLERRVLQCASTHNVDRQASPLVDLGCGRGLLGAHLAKIAGCHGYVGVDRTLASGGPVATGLVVGDLRTLPLRSESFRLAIAVDSLYLVGDAVRTLLEVRRILETSGRLILSLYSRSDSLSGERGPPYWLDALERSGFTVLEWHDVTLEWRELMVAKHAARLNASHELLETFGYSVQPFISVSHQMLGTAVHPGFARSTSRWEVVARAH
jgi:SAM-dependent methyltransferase